MQRHGKSLFVDDKHALAAVHYQNRLVERDSICYSCHKDYALFGDVKAKLNGLRHVWAHYVAGVPASLALYQPYPNANCLHCHDDARRFVEHPPHRPVIDALQSGLDVVPDLPPRRARPAQGRRAHLLAGRLMSGG